MMTRCLLWLGLLLAAAGPAHAGETIVIRELQPRVTLRLTAFAEDAQTISSTIHGPQIKFLVPDGSPVQEGQLLTEFDDAEVKQGLRDLEFERAELESRQARDLTDTRNKAQKLQDDLDSITDRLAVLRTSQARLLALPDKDQVEIAASHLRVAQLEFSAASNELFTAQGRLQRQMISPAEFDKFDEECQGRKARLERAAKHLEYARLPADPLVLQRRKLEIANLEMEAEKLIQEIRDTAEIAEIQKKGASAQSELIAAKIQEKKDELGHTRILAPISGHVMYLKRFRDDILITGNKMWRNYSFLRIPDPTTLAFKGQLPESERGLFQAGDRAILNMVGSPDRPLEGRIKSISQFSRDRSEKEEGSWGQAKDESGILVYDVVVTIDKPRDWIKVGMHAAGELLSSVSLKGPSVPITHVHERNGEHHISIDGLYRKVEGRVARGFLVLDSPELDGRRVDLSGRFPDSGETQTPPHGLQGRFRAQGELRPTTTTDVPVERILGWQKIAWLIKEDSQVKPGDVLARLDEKEINDDIQKWESRLKQAVSEREALEQQSGLKAREAEFRLGRERNLLEIARIDRQLAEESRDRTAIADAGQAVTLASLRHAALDRQIGRLEGKATLSPLELDRLKRDRRRAELESEAARLRLARLQEGSDNLARKRAILAFVEQELKVRTLEKNIDTERVRILRELERSRESEAYMRRTLADRRTWKANHTIQAPCAGLVQYTRVWNSGVLSKATVGTAVGSRMVMLRIADLSRMYARAEIPERHFTRVKPGLPVKLHVPSAADALFPGRISEVGFLFENKTRKDTQGGVYSSHEPLGETIFHVDVELDTPPTVKLKPGTATHVYFPFDK